MIIKNWLPQRPLSLVTGEEVSVGFPGGLAVGGAGVRTAGRLHIRLSWYRCSGILIVLLLLHFKKGRLGLQTQYSDGNLKGKFLILLAVKSATSNQEKT